MLRRLPCAIALVTCVLAAASRAAGLEFSGYAKNLLIGSRTVLGPDDRYTSNLSRLRLELKGSLAPRVSVDLQYDNELLLGDYLRTQQFQVQKDMPPPTYWKAQAEYIDHRRAYAFHRLHRASLTATLGDTDVRLGRQRIVWGTGRFWSPLDLFNPVSPVAIERAERVGVDALLFERKLGAISRAALAHAPRHRTSEASTAALWHGNRSGFDYSLVAGRFRGRTVIGLDLAGQVGQAGLRAEVARMSGRPRVLLGVDHAFAHTLTLSAELYYDGTGTTDRERYDFPALLSGRVQNLGKRYVGVSGSYEITPLLKMRHDAAVNVDDGSGYYSPTLTWSIRADLDATLGAQFFRGRRGTELAAFRRLLYAQLQWFF
jgi:hypothetical protein